MEECPDYHSENVTQVADFISDGYNGYVCNHCGCHIIT